jgi:hypothetical protein
MKATDCSRFFVQREEWGKGKAEQGFKVRIDDGVHNADSANVETQAVTWRVPIACLFSAKKTPL